jgi:hypothetical protein
MLSEVGPATQAEGAAAIIAASRRTRGRIAAVYTIAGLAAAAVMTAIYLYANAIAFLPLRTLYVFGMFAWPIVLTLGLAVAISWRGWAAITAIYLLAMAAVVWPSLNDRFTPAAALLAWSIHNLPATVMALVFLARPIRAVGPLVMAFTFAAISGASVAVNVIGASDDRIRAAAKIGETFGLGGHQTFFAVMLVGILVLGLVGWLLLKLLGRLYRSGRASDLSLTVDSLWLMFTLHHAIDMVFAGPSWFFVALASFATFKLVAWLGFKALQQRAASATEPRLLLLRVFSLGRRSERLFAAFSKLWRPAGSIRMIAGPDLATSTVEPHEFLDFVAGRLSRRFIDGEAALARRIEETAARRAADGRWRIAEFFCHDDTWKIVLQRLAASSDAVMMDLRGFTRANRGCVYEIHALLDLVPLARIVLVTDTSTDAAYLSEVVAEGWEKLAAASPNRSDPKPAVRALRLDRIEQAPSLMRAVAAAARSAPLTAPVAG